MKIKVPSGETCRLCEYRIITRSKYSKCKLYNCMLEHIGDNVFKIPVFRKCRQCVEAESEIVQEHEI